LENANALETQLLDMLLAGDDPLFRGLREQGVSLRVQKPRAANGANSARIARRRPLQVNFGVGE
jgi:hypothetical protein